jgi:hypothetical protein
VDLRVGDLLAAPIGVTLLDRIELEGRMDFLPFDALSDHDPSAIQIGVQLVDETTVGALLDLTLDAANHLAGPWSPGAPSSLASAYKLASARRPIAEAICRRFGSQLAERPDMASQECWWSDARKGGVVPPAFTDFGSVYGNGEFPWNGFWTVTSPPPEIHDDLIGAWEMVPGPISRWRLSVRPEVRLWTIDRPSDWARLVETYPKVASKKHSGWELPGPNQHLQDIRLLMAVPAQNAVRSNITRQLLPDWDAVAHDYQGVHLSWAGFLTSEGYVSDLAEGGATMLRYWASERTLWLEDVFGDPEPLDAPELTGSINGALGLDEMSGDHDRLARHRVEICTRLGR